MLLSRHVSSVCFESRVSLAGGMTADPFSAAASSKLHHSLAASSLFIVLRGSFDDFVFDRDGRRDKRIGLRWNESRLASAPSPLIIHTMHSMKLALSCVLSFLSSSTPVEFSSLERIATTLQMLNDDNKERYPRPHKAFMLLPKPEASPCATVPT